MFEIFLLSIYNYQNHSNLYLWLLNLTKVGLFNFIYIFLFSLQNQYYSEAAIGSVPKIPQNKRLLANTNFDKMFEKYLTESSFILKLQTLSLKIHWKLNSFKGNFQRLKNLKNTFFQITFESTCSCGCFWILISQTKHFN